MKSFPLSSPFVADGNAFAIAYACLVVMSD